MIVADSFDSIPHLQDIDPQSLRDRVHCWREKARRCSDLAVSSVTPEGKQTLSDMAADFESRADHIEDAMAAVARLYREPAGQDA